MKLTSVGVKAVQVGESSEVTYPSVSAGEYRMGRTDMHVLAFAH